MPKVKITADSTCDLSEQLLREYDIGIVPLYVILDGKPYRDMFEIKPQDIFDYVARTGELPTTSAATIEDYKKEFSIWREQGFDVVHLNLSSEFSSSHQNALIAAEGDSGVYVIDSRNLSTGTGLLVLKAAELAREGRSASEIYHAVRDQVDKVRASFVIDRLDYLKKGGRCSSIAALGATLLKIKPSIKVDGGFMKVGEKYRGDFSKAIIEYVDATLSRYSDVDPSLIFVTHTNCAPDIVESVKAAIRRNRHFENIYETRAGCVITAHCGPSTLGILFKER